MYWLEILAKKHISRNKMRGQAPKSHVSEVEEHHLQGTM